MKPEWLNTNQAARYLGINFNYHTMFLRIATQQASTQRIAKLSALVCTPVQAAESESLNGLNRLHQISHVDASESSIEKI